MTGRGMKKGREHKPATLSRDDTAIEIRTRR